VRFSAARLPAIRGRLFFNFLKKENLQPWIDSA